MNYVWTATVITYIDHDESTADTIVAIFDAKPSMKTMEDMVSKYFEGIALECTKDCYDFTIFESKDSQGYFTFNQVELLKGGE